MQGSKNGCNMRNFRRFNLTMCKTVLTLDEEMKLIKGTYVLNVQRTSRKI